MCGRIIHIIIIILYTQALISVISLLWSYFDPTLILLCYVNGIPLTLAPLSSYCTSQIVNKLMPGD